MVHLVLKPSVLVLCEVGEAAGRDLHQLTLNVQRGVVEQLLGLQELMGKDFNRLKIFQIAITTQLL